MKDFLFVSICLLALASAGFMQITLKGSLSFNDLSERYTLSHIHETHKYLLMSLDGAYIVEWNETTTNITTRALNVSSDISADILRDGSRILHDDETDMLHVVGGVLANGSAAFPAEFDPDTEEFTLINIEGALPIVISPGHYAFDGQMYFAGSYDGSKQLVSYDMDGHYFTIHPNLPSVAQTPYIMLNANRTGLRILWRNSTQAVDFLINDTSISTPEYGSVYTHNITTEDKAPYLFHNEAETFFPEFSWTKMTSRNYLLTQQVEYHYDNAMRFSRASWGVRSTNSNHYIMTADLEQDLLRYYYVDFNKTHCLPGYYIHPSIPYCEICPVGNACPGGSANTTVVCDGSSEYQDLEGQASCKSVPWYMGKDGNSAIKISIPVILIFVAVFVVVIVVIVFVARRPKKKDQNFSRMDSLQSDPRNIA